MKNAICKEIYKSKKNELVEFTTLKFDDPFYLEKELAEKDNASNKEIALLKALSELSDSQREIIYYRFTCDFEYDQICEIMSMKYDSARKMVFRALKTLRENLTDTNFSFFMMQVMNKV